MRLRQGDMNDSTIFSDNPAAMARRWVDAGARRLHLVDLNGAFAGKPVNEAAVKAILAEVGDEIPVQLGGGIRDLDTIERYLDDGLSYIIIGTAAVKNPGFMRDACSAFGGHIIVGLDAKDGKVATDGWSKLTGHEVADLAKKFEDYGVEGIVYTDIGRDGMLTGVNIDATVKLAQVLTIPVFASGGSRRSPTSRSSAPSRTSASRASSAAARSTAASSTSPPRRRAPTSSPAPDTPERLRDAPCGAAPPPRRHARQTNHSLPRRHRRPRRQGRQLRRAARRRRSGRDRRALQRAGRRRAHLPRHHGDQRRPRPDPARSSRRSRRRSSFRSRSAAACAASPTCAASSTPAPTR